MQISKIRSRQVLDSRGNPTVETEVELDTGDIGCAAVPSGASTGKHEACELRDGGKDYGGKAVTKAVKNVTDVIAPKLVGLDPSDQKAIDQTMRELDGTDNKSKLGANAILSVSLATAKATAKAKKIPFYEYIASLAGNNEFLLPMPMFNVINGGQHAKGSTDIQEFMIVPNGLDNFDDCLQAGAEIFHKLGEILSKEGLTTTVGDEGGYAPKLSENTQAIQLIGQAAKAAGYDFGKDIFVALDVAASELQQPDGTYKLLKEHHTSFSSRELIDHYKSICNHLPVMSIEDGLSEDDWDSWPSLTNELAPKVMLVADDLTVTNPKLLQKAIDMKAATTILIKPNQIGSLSETIETVKMAHVAGWRTIISHRSGETEDTSISHIAVGLGIPFIKSGSLSRSERLSKYNELLRIGEKLPSGYKIRRPS